LDSFENYEKSWEQLKTMGLFPPAVLVLAKCVCFVIDSFIHNIGLFIDFLFISRFFLAYLNIRSIRAI